MDSKKEKRGKVMGFDGISGKNTADKLENMAKNVPAGNWRR